MVRPVKQRRVCKLPRQNTFGPTEPVDTSEINTLSVEAYETIRLIDYLGLTQEEAAFSMGVARSTIQRMYDEARKMIADSIVNSKTLKIEGGNYTLCSEDAVPVPDSSGCDANMNCPKRSSGKRCCELE